MSGPIPRSVALVLLAVSVACPQVSAQTLEGEHMGQTAEKLGLDQDAFDIYIRAYHSLPDPAPAAAELRLRERIITVARRLPKKPIVPEAARVHFTKATSLIDAETLLGAVGTESMVTAAAELMSAIRLAPWWPEPTFTLATVLQKLQRFDEAVANLNVYRLADPDGYAAAIAAKTGVRVPSREMAVARTEPATLYIYWPKQVRGDGRPKVMCDGFHVADIQNRHFVVLNVTPGTHSIGVHNKALALPFESGQKYYIRANVSGFPARIDIEQAAAAEGEAALRSDDMKANDPRRTYSIECNAGAGKQRRR